MAGEPVGLPDETWRNDAKPEPLEGDQANQRQRALVLEGAVLQPDKYAGCHHYEADDELEDERPVWAKLSAPG